MSIFLSDPIDDLNIFVDKGRKEFIDEFNRFEKIAQSELKFEVNQGSLGNSEISIPTDVGFRFTSEQDGEITKMFRGLNERDRTFISYHDLRYDDWDVFFEDYESLIKKIATIRLDLNVVAFSLYYIDEFYWISDQVIDLKQVFVHDSEFLPLKAFESMGVSYNLTTERLFENNPCYERFEIQSSNSAKTISISHNLTRVLNEPIGLTELIGSDEFKRILNWAHLQNKEFLFSLLLKSVTDLINLQHDSDS